MDIKKIESIEGRAFAMGIAFAKSTTMGPIDPIVPSLAVSVDPSVIRSIALDFAEGVFQTMQEVRIESGHDTIDYHSVYALPTEFADDQNDD